MKFENLLLDFRNIEWIEYIFKNDILYDEIEKMTEFEFEEYYKWLAESDITIVFDTDSEMYLIYPLYLEEEVENYLKGFKDMNIDSLLLQNRDTEDEVLKEYIKEYEELKKELKNK